MVYSKQQLIRFQLDRKKKNPSHSMNSETLNRLLLKAAESPSMKALGTG